jgi:hypothetical protein
VAERFAVHAYLTEEAHGALSAVAEENGVSVTGLLEALGRLLDKQIRDGGQGAEATELGELGTVKEIVKSARKIDALRRRRGGG